MSNTNQFSQIVNVFQGKHLPEADVLLAGYSAIIKTFNLNIPIPDTLAAISHKHVNYEKDSWQMFSPRYAPKNSLYGQLVFALKYEGINLAVLKALFEKISIEEFLQIVKQKASGSYTRRMWFLYEWLQDIQLPIPNAKAGKYIDVLSASLQYPGPTKISKRHTECVRGNETNFSLKYYAAILAK